MVIAETMLVAAVGGGARARPWRSCSRCAAIPPAACCRSSTCRRTLVAGRLALALAVGLVGRVPARAFGRAAARGRRPAAGLRWPSRSSTTCDRLRARWTSTVVAVLGIAGTVGVFVAMLSLARGFEATLVASGSPRNAIVRRAGATSARWTAGSRVDQVRVIEDAPGVARAAGVGPLVSPEVVVVAAFPLQGPRTDGNAQVRGVSPKALAVRPSVKLVAGRMFQPGLTELVVGQNVAAATSASSSATRCASAAARGRWWAWSTPAGTRLRLRALVRRRRAQAGLPASPRTSSSR